MARQPTFSHVLEVYLTNCKCDFFLVYIVQNATLSLPSSPFSIISYIVQGFSGPLALAPQPHSSGVGKLHHRTSRVPGREAGRPPPRCTEARNSPAREMWRRTWF